MALGESSRSPGEQRNRRAKTSPDRGQNWGKFRYSRAFRRRVTGKYCSNQSFSSELQTFLTTNLYSSNMASKTFVRSIRAASKQKLPAGSLQKRSYSSVLAIRPTLAAQPKAAFAAPAQQTRGIKTIDFAGTKETVFEREDWPREKLQVYWLYCFQSGD